MASGEKGKEKIGFYIIFFLYSHLEQKYKYNYIKLIDANIYMWYKYL